MANTTTRDTRAYDLLTGAVTLTAVLAEELTLRLVPSSPVQMKILGEIDDAALSLKRLIGRVFVGGNS